MRDRKNSPEEENKPQSSQQNILGNNQIGGNLTVRDINQYFLSLAGLSDSQPIPLTINQSSPQHPPLLFDLLLQIDFKNQFRLVKTAIDKHQTIGFLVHGELDCGQQMLVNRLYRVKPTWQNHKPISIDVSSNAGYSNLSKLWGRVAGCLDLPRDAEHNLILERICDRLKTQDVIFIFSKVELMLFTKTLNMWWKQFALIVVCLGREDWQNG
jgi:hypothetical protein